VNTVLFARDQTGSDKSEKKVEFCEYPTVQITLRYKLRIIRNSQNIHHPFSFSHCANFLKIEF